MSEKIGFIGLGIMGLGMAKNLQKAGHDLKVWNRTPEKAQELIGLGVPVAESPKSLAQTCDILFICVSDSPDVVAVVEGDDGILAGLDQGKLVVDHSTISPKITLDLAHQVNAQGGFWLDAPVSGGSEGAAKGTLSIMIGGDETQVERARPFLETMGKTITHVGPQGAGQMAKLVNQILVVVTGLAVSEAMLFAQAGGLDLDRTLKAVEGGAAGSWMLSNRGSQMIIRDWRPGFTIDLQQKDLRLVLEAADQLGVPLLATNMVFNLYRALQEQGLGMEGNHALLKALENLSGIIVGEAAHESI